MLERLFLNHPPALAGHCDPDYIASIWWIAGWLCFVFPSLRSGWQMPTLHARGELCEQDGGSLGMEVGKSIREEHTRGPRKVLHSCERISCVPLSDGLPSFCQDRCALPLAHDGPTAKKPTVPPVRLHFAAPVGRKAARFSGQGWR
jgi:hypothetical protein